MGEKDILEKTLEAYNDVFADIVNVLLFKGKQVVSEDELVDRLPRSHYKAAGKVHEVERDVAKIWKTGKIRIALIGYENQTEADPDMPLRMIGYDGAEYRVQLTKENEGGTRYPVITLVLYFGYKKRWDQAKSLWECLDIPEEVKPYVNDYKLNLFEIAYLSKEEVKQFKSDFRAVADYFVQMRENGEYKPEEQELKHVEETLQLLSVMTGDNRFEEIYKEENREGRVTSMSEALDRIEQRGWQQGWQDGRQQGWRDGQQDGQQKGENAIALLIQKLLEMGRMDDIKKAAENRDYRHRLMKELSISE